MTRRKLGIQIKRNVWKLTLWGHCGKQLYGIIVSKWMILSSGFSTLHIPLFSMIWRMFFTLRCNSECISFFFFYTEAGVLRWRDVRTLPSDFNVPHPVTTTSELGGNLWVPSGKHALRILLANNTGEDRRTRAMSLSWAG